MHLPIVCCLIKSLKIQCSTCHWKGDRVYHFMILHVLTYGMLVWKGTSYLLKCRAWDLTWTPQADLMGGVSVLKHEPHKSGRNSERNKDLNKQWLEWRKDVWGWDWRWHVMSWGVRGSWLWLVLLASWLRYDNLKRLFSWFWIPDQTRQFLLWFVP